MKRVIIVGAGPAGLAAAYKLAGKAEVLLIDQGKLVKERRCPSPQKCIHCKNCGKTDGVGGAGTFSDGKFIFETLIGKREVGSNLSEVIGRENERTYLKKAKEFFKKYGVEEIKLDANHMLRAEKIARIAAINDMDYIFSSQAHIGTDKLPELIEKIEIYLKLKGVKILTQEFTIKFDKSNVYTNKNSYSYDFLILAPGRKGADWLEEVLKENSIPVTYRAIDIGLRIETDAKVLENLIKVARDIKLSFRVPGNGDSIRTFCACPNGVVTRETYERKGFNLVNGACDSKKQTENSNFALLMSIPLTHSVHCNNYGDAIAKVFHFAGADKPVLQRLGDLKIGKRSKEEKLSEYRIKPTLKDVLIGDIGFGLPYRIMNGLLYGIERLSVPGLMEGLNQSSTLLYAPEMKRTGLKIKTNEYLEAAKNIYVAGDGSGFSRGITGAAASGILAADGILRNL